MLNQSICWISLVSLLISLFFDHYFFWRKKVSTCNHKYGLKCSIPSFSYNSKLIRIGVKFESCSLAPGPQHNSCSHMICWVQLLVIHLSVFLIRRQLCPYKEERLLWFFTLETRALVLCKQFVFVPLLFAFKVKDILKVISFVITS